MSKYETLQEYKKDGLLDNLEIWLSNGYWLRPTKKTVLFYSEELDAIMLTDVYVNLGVSKFYDKRYVVGQTEITRIDI